MWRPPKACLTHNTVGHTAPIRYTPTIHELPGTSSERQPCLGMSWYDLDSNVARVCKTKHGYTRSSKVCYGLNTICKMIFIGLLYVPSTVCYGLVRLNTTYSINWTFTGFTYGPTNFCSSSIPYDLYTILTWLSSLVEWTSCVVVYTVLYGLTRFLTVLYDR